MSGKEEESATQWYERAARGYVRETPGLRLGGRSHCVFRSRRLDRVEFPASSATSSPAITTTPTATTTVRPDAARRRTEAAPPPAADSFAPFLLCPRSFPLPPTPMPEALRK